MKQMLHTKFPSRLHVYALMTLLMTGFGISSLSVFGGLVLFITYILLISLSVIVGLFLLSLAFVKIAIMFAAQRGNWGARAIHGLGPLIGIGLWWAGGQAARPAIVLALSPRIERGIGDVVAQHPPYDEEVEVISLHPEIAVLRTGYTPGFAAPGDTKYFLLDRSGHLADLSEQGRSRELSQQREMHRDVGAYCALKIMPWFGSYYVATHYDIDGCA